MTDISQSILQQMGLKSSPFPISSRYNSIEIITMASSDGESIVYLKRRFIPPVEKFFLLQEHTVKESERLDNITVQYIGDPERFWQICDANNEMVPDNLTEEPGNKIRITLPEGIQGS